MQFQQYLNESVITKFIKPLKKLDFGKAKRLLKDNFNDMIRAIEDNGLEDRFLKLINKHLNTNYTSIKSLKKLHENEQNKINEDFKHLWDVFKIEGWPAISVFPALSLWFEFDKLFSGVGLSDLNWKKVAFYSALWLIMVSAKHLKQWASWKKNYPDEWEKEGKPGILRKGK